MTQDDVFLEDEEYDLAACKRLAAAVVEQAIEDALRYPMFPKSALDRSFREHEDAVEFFRDPPRLGYWCGLNGTDVRIVQEKVLARIDRRTRCRRPCCNEDVEDDHGQVKVSSFAR